MKFQDITNLISYLNKIRVLRKKLDDKKNISTIDR